MKFCNQNISRFKRWSLLFLMLSVAACDHDNEGGRSDPAPESHATLEIQIISTDGTPVTAARVLIDGVSRGQSNANGFIEIDDLESESSFTLLLDKEDFASQIINHETGSTDTSASIEVIMIPRQAAVVFNNNVEKTLVGQFGASIELKGDDFVDASGTVVSGEIEMRMTPVDVSTAAGLEAFPGTFSAIDEAGDDVAVIVTYGTTEFSFTKNSQAVQLGNGKTAIIELPLFIDKHPDGSDVALGDQIPLWYLNEDSGIWIQEGSGVVVDSASSKTGFALRGEVSHFTWWNIDVPVDTANISVKVDLSDPTINTAGLTAVVTGSTTNFNTGTVSIPVGQRSHYFKVPAGQELCFSSKVVVDSGLPSAQLFSSPLQCGVVLTPGENRDLDIVVNVTDFSVTAEVVPTATAGSDISACGVVSRLLPNGFLAPVNYSILSGSLPSGIQLDAHSGILHGAPQLAGNSGPVVVRATDASGRVADSAAFSIDVSPALILTIAETVPMLNVNQPYSSTNLLASSGGYGSHVLGQYNDSSLPPGLVFNAVSGNVSGTALPLVVNTQVQAYYARTGRFEVTDQNCATAQVDHDIRVLYAPVLSGVAAADVQVGNAVDYAALNTGGPVETWSLAGNPDWLSIDASTGVLQGVPAESHIASNISFSIIAENNIAHAFDPPGHAELAVNFAVTQIAPALNTANDINMSIDQALSVLPVNSGGVAATWSINTQPAWSGFNTATGELSGMPVAGDEGTSSNIIITASNAAGSSSYGPFNLTVTAGSIPVPVVGGTPPAAKVNVAYSFTAGNSGGAADSWSLAGSLPAGLTFNTGSGEISGLPVTAGNFSDLIITASNSSGPSNAHNLSISVAKGDQFIAFNSSDQGSVVRTMGGVLTNIASGGDGAGAISYNSDTPSTATVDVSNGVISIIANGTTIITATKAEDANYLSASSFYTLTVEDEGPVIISGPLSVSKNLAAASEFFSYTPVLESGLNILWSITGLPYWADFDSASGIITAYVDEYNAGVYENIMITATNTVTASAAVLGPVTITFLPSSAPVIETSMSDNSLTVYHDESGDLSRIPLANSGGPSTSWTISGDYPDQGSGWLRVDVNPYQYPDIYQFENDPTVQYIGKWNVSLTAENPLGTDTLSFAYEVKLKIPRLNVRANAGMLAVDWIAVDQSALTVPVPIKYDLYVSDQAGFTPENPLSLPGDLHSNYTSATAISNVNGSPVSVGKTYYMMLVASYTNSESRTEEFKITVEALPDTGVLECTDGSTIDTSHCQNAVANAAYPNQDGLLGRSAMTNSWPEQYTVPDYTYLNDAGDEGVYPDQVCIRDNVTGLLWQRASHASVNLAAITAEMNALNDVSSVSNCAVTDWRLPTSAELLSIVNYRRFIRVSYFFNNIVAGSYWSSDVLDPLAATPLNWTMSFADGLLYNADITAASNINAILVSGTSTSPDFVDNLNGTVTDNVTGLVWKKCSEGYRYNATGASAADKCQLDGGDSTAFSWQDGLIRAKAVNEGGVGESLMTTNWRLPNIKELNSLLNRAHAAGVAGMFDSFTLPNTSLSNFWSSSINSYSPTQGLSLNLNDTGVLGSTDITALLPVRLVSSPPAGQPTTRWYRDSDADTYGIENDFIDAVLQPSNYVSSYWQEWDCDDSSADIYPYASEIIGDGIDNNCNGIIDEGVLDPF